MQRKPDKGKEQRRGGASGVAPPTAGRQTSPSHSSPPVSSEMEADRRGKCADRVHAELQRLCAV